ncbi:hypothetical protein DSM106972_089420 [Dulcicalothrix desertica PCC 7102]|uniref:Uncharacterized protein n=1 Tax=Dulcicalothrix desertica PCC 7102 TaxID=232991 RepID=A0A433UP34_9CYAN|nr:hypothetical protein [Dulcicalothrix desertica]RUS95586.1 hypothetical protein DSM106972_089420 [Dulcicalothrix desertica PCC 7102]
MYVPHIPKICCIIHLAFSGNIAPENIYWLIEYSNTSLEKDLEDVLKVEAGIKCHSEWSAAERKRSFSVGSNLGFETT